MELIVITTVNEKEIRETLGDYESPVELLLKTELTGWLNPSGIYLTEFLKIEDMNYDNK